MYEIEKIDERETLPLRLAYEFLTQEGFQNQASEIRQSKDRYKSYTSTLRRGKILELLERNNLPEEFIDKYWPFGKTENGKRKVTTHSAAILSPFAFCYSERSEESDNAQGRLRRRISETLRFAQGDIRIAV